MNASLEPSEPVNKELREAIEQAQAFLSTSVPTSVTEDYASSWGSPTKWP
jgi:hypothetical protein